jgi:hypothetical protein
MRLAPHTTYNIRDLGVRIGQALAPHGQRLHFRRQVILPVCVGGRLVAGLAYRVQH